MGHHKPRPSLGARLKSKRVLVVSTATLGVLALGGAAGAYALSGQGGAPESAVGAITIPDAQTSAPVAPSSTDPKTREQARSQRADAVEQASTTTQAQAEQAKEEPEPEESAAADSGSADNQGSGSTLTPSGEGGQCEASMYGDPQPTASGETFDPSAMTAAHKTLPFDTMVEVTNTANGKSVTVRINDRGPFISGRCLDLSTASFTQIASANAGVAQVQWQVVS
ncbi:septal ring lytic transglycosylase RlpA family protein [Nocardiopsis ansamitocini]|uniref:Probable endolytic peptidoglycan transglycosylase RlpA n=1 Tax=Nocardiopsis ansamitocini TaxID=1670832 RepID=A0A9W6UH41_9ACTN|nr:septal ring lytic transglycosylase RlpA family protein [Nocardiopsis ansamitocini]GLU48436.1 hypothetical protein Nans01_27870 [Nocardiopsis ansamitocini]